MPAPSFLNHVPTNLFFDPRSVSRRTPRSGPPPSHPLKQLNMMLPDPSPSDAAGNAIVKGHLELGSQFQAGIQAVRLSGGEARRLTPRQRVGSTEPDQAHRHQGHYMNGAQPNSFRTMPTAYLQFEDDVQAAMQAVKLPGRARRRTMPLFNGSMEKSIEMLDTRHRAPPQHVQQSMLSMHSGWVQHLQLLQQQHQQHHQLPLRPVSPVAPTFSFWEGPFQSPTSVEGFQSSSVTARHARPLHQPHVPLVRQREEEVKAELARQQYLFHAAAAPHPSFVHQPLPHSIGARQGRYSPDMILSLQPQMTKGYSPDSDRGHHHPPMTKGYRAPAMADLQPTPRSMTVCASVNGRTSRLAEEGMQYADWQGSPTGAAVNRMGGKPLGRRHRAKPPARALRPGEVPASYSRGSTSSSVVLPQLKMRFTAGQVLPYRPSDISDASPQAAPWQVQSPSNMRSSSRDAQESPVDQLAELASNSPQVADIDNSHRLRALHSNRYSKPWTPSQHPPPLTWDGK